MINIDRPKEMTEATVALCAWFKSQEISSGASVLIMLRLTAVILGRQSRSLPELAESLILSTEVLSKYAIQTREMK